MTTTEYQPLTLDYIQSHIGEVITWFCYGYRGNSPYKGQCRLLDVIRDERDRIVPVVEHIAGDELHYGWFEGNELNYSDSGRIVHIGDPFDLYVLSWDVPHMGFLHATGNPMTCSATVYAEDRDNLPAVFGRKTTATNYQYRKII